MKRTFKNVIIAYEKSEYVISTFLRLLRKRCDGMEYITTKEAAELWGYSEDTIRKWCRKGMLTLVCKPEKKNGRWQIPANVQCPKVIKKDK